jgi:hypothetical protein
MLEKKNGKIINRITGRESSGLQNPKYPFGYGTDNFGSIDVSTMAKKHGLGWGGNWKSSTDTMHFSTGPNEMTEPTPQAMAARGGGGGSEKGEETKTASAGAQATPVSKPPVTSGQSQGPDESSTDKNADPKETKKTTPPAPPPPATAVAGSVTKGAQLNRESTSSEVASVAIPARASMNNIMKGSGQQKESDIPVNPKITDANRAGNVEPEDAAQRYESLFGMKPKVPTGSTTRAA